MSEHCQHCADSCDLYFAISNRLHTSGKSAWVSGECPYCQERVSIVNWLRLGPTEWAQCCECDRDTFLAADLIEHGEHLRTKDE